MRVLVAGEYSGAVRNVFLRIAAAMGEQWRQLSNAGAAAA